MLLIKGLIACLTVSMLASLASAQPFPSRPIRLIVPVVPGAATDVLARVTGDWIAQQSGQSVVVENRPGAGGMIAINFVARSEPDGHTLLFTADGQIIMQPLISEQKTIDPLTDLVSVAPIADLPTVLAISAKLPTKTLQEFVAYGKANPGKLNYASSGIGSAPHIAGAAFAQQAGIDMVHVPYRGLGTALTDLMAGNVHMIAAGNATLGPLVQSGALRRLAVTSKQRLPYLPDLITGVEANYPDLLFSTWFGLFAPAKTPKPVVDQLNSYIQSFLGNPGVQKRLAESYYDGMKMSPAEFTDFVKSRIEQGRRLVKELAIEPN